MANSAGSASSAAPALTSPTKPPKMSKADRRKAKANAATATAVAAAASTTPTAASSGSPAVAQPLNPAAPAFTPAPVAAVPVMNPHGVIGGTPFQGSASRDVMKEFSANNKNADGKPRCFNFWRRGLCDRGTGCAFAHN